jgi:hypothetical protein
VAGRRSTFAFRGSSRVLPSWAGPHDDELFRLGWRAGIGAALILGGYLALLLIPLVLASDLEPKLKAALIGVIGLTLY